MYLPKRVRQKVTSVLRRYFYLKLCFNRAYSYIQTPIDMTRDFTIIAVALKVYGYNNMFVVVTAFLLTVIVAILMGHIDVKNKFAHIEQSVINQINPELMSIFEETKHKKK